MDEPTGGNKQSYALFSCFKSTFTQSERTCFVVASKPSLFAFSWDLRKGIMNYCDLDNVQDEALA